VIDMYNRRINYLRMGITDRCNLRCRYCMPATGVPLKEQEDILTLEEFITLARIAGKCGIDCIRITGGEPLVRKNVTVLVKGLAAIEAIKEISMTTNATLLDDMAVLLKEAGLKRVNISLDTLREDRYRYITRGGEIKSVWRGIRSALSAGLQPVKLNVVVSRGFNDDEILDFVRLAKEEPLHIRFIELMPIGAADRSRLKYVAATEMQYHVNRYYNLEPLTDLVTNGPAVNYRIKGGEGSIGFISAMSSHFCRSCNRLRLTADGRLRSCLFWDGEFDLKGPLRSGASEQELKALFNRAVISKPFEHQISTEWHQERLMSQIGG